MRMAKVLLQNSGGTVNPAAVPNRVMNCRDTIRLICEYLEGRLSPPVADEMLRHIDRCKNCAVVTDLGAAGAGGSDAFGPRAMAAGVGVSPASATMPRPLPYHS